MNFDLWLLGGNHNGLAATLGMYRFDRLFAQRLSLALRMRVSDGKPRQRGIRRENAEKKPQSCLRGLNQGASTIHFYSYKSECPESPQWFTYFLHFCTNFQSFYGYTAFHAC